MEPTVIRDCSGSMENTENPPCALFKEKNRINVYGAPDLLLGSYKESSDSVYKTFEHLWKNKGNSDASGSF